MDFKKVLRNSITASITLISLWLGAQGVLAYNNTCPSDKPFSVKMINNNNTETDIGCYSTVADAQAVMKELSSDATSTAVILEKNEVIDAAYGILQFANVGGTDLIHYYSTSTTTSSKTYIASSGNYGGDAAYLGLENGRYKNTISGLTGYIDSARANIVPLSRAIGISYYTRSKSGEIQHVISKDPTQIGKANTVTLGPAPSFMKEDVKYYSYDGNYFYLNLKDLLDDYKEGTHLRATNPDNPYYNYYQYLPYHTLTGFSAEEIDFYISNIQGYTEKPTSYATLKGNQSMLSGEGESFVSSQNYYGTNALLTYGIAINESGFGRSNISISKNNLFGHSAYDNNTSAATTYATIKDGIDVHNNSYVSWGYLYAKDYRYFGGHVGNKNSGMNVKYASDPYWGEKAAAYYYSVDKSLGGNEYQRYTVGIKTFATTLNVRKEATTNSTALFALPAVSNVPVVIIGTVKGETINGSDIWYKIQSDSYLDTNRNLIEKSSDSSTRPAYSFDSSYGYVHSSFIYTSDIEIQEVPGNFYFDKLTFNEKTKLFTFSGYLTITGMNNSSNVEILYELIFKNKDTNEEYSYQLNRNSNHPFEIPSQNGYDYSASWFSGELNLEDLPQGDYTAIVRASTGYKYSTAMFRNTFSKEMVSSAILGNGNSVVFRTNYYLKTIPIEIFVRINGGISEKTVNGIDNMINSYSTIDFDAENGKLNLKGVSYNIGLDYSLETKVSRLLTLEKQDNFARTTHNLTTLDAGDYAVTLRVDDGKSKQKAWYEGSISLVDLADGVYTIYVSTKTDGGSDYGELNDIFNKKLPEAIHVGEKLFSLQNDGDNRNRIELVVKTNKIEPPEVETPSESEAADNQDDSTKPVDNQEQAPNLEDKGEEQ